MKPMVLVIMLSPLAMVSGQPRTDRWRDMLFGPVKTVVETNSQSECKKPEPGKYFGSIAITSYDREGNKTTESSELLPSCANPAIHYVLDPDGSVRSYQDANLCGAVPVKILLYKILRSYDASLKTLKEEYYHGDVLTSRVEYVYDSKGRLAKKKTSQLAEPVTAVSRFRFTAEELYTYSTGVWKKVTIIREFKPFVTEELYTYSAGEFPKKVTFIRDGKALWSDSYQYALDPRGNWTKRIAVQHPGAVKVPVLKTVACRELTYY